MHLRSTLARFLIWTSSAGSVLRSDTVVAAGRVVAMTCCMVLVGCTSRIGACQGTLADGHQVFIIVHRYRWSHAVIEEAVLAPQPTADGIVPLVWLTDIGVAWGPLRPNASPGTFTSDMSDREFTQAVRQLLIMQHDIHHLGENLLDLPPSPRQGFACFDPARGVFIDTYYKESRTSDHELSLSWSKYAMVPPADPHAAQQPTAVASSAPRQILKGSPEVTPLVWYSMLKDGSPVVIIRDRARGQKPRLIEIVASAEAMEGDRHRLLFCGPIPPPVDPSARPRVDERLPSNGHLGRFLAAQHDPDHWPGNLLQSEHLQGWMVPYGGIIIDISTRTIPSAHAMLLGAQAQAVLP